MGKYFRHWSPQLPDKKEVMNRLVNMTLTEVFWNMLHFPQTIKPLCFNILEVVFVFHYFAYHHIFISKLYCIILRPGNWKMECMWIHPLKHFLKIDFNWARRHGDRWWMWITHWVKCETAPGLRSLGVPLKAPQAIISLWSCDYFNFVWDMHH